MPRLVRRQPLIERVKAYLNPLDLLLRISEELDSQDWDDFGRTYATPLGVVVNVVFLIARGNGHGSKTADWEDDVFGDGNSRRGWLSWLSRILVLSLSFLSVANATYTFYRKRHYRLFEVSVDAPPRTSSARRVRVDSSPISSSPLRFLSSLIDTDTPESRAHPDPTRDVWELAIWDPLPICVRLFCLFSPGHVLVYWLFLPTTQYDPRPGTTVLTAIVLAILLSTQLWVLQSAFSQQSKDSALINREVLNEYNTKYVHPILNIPVRDVGIQYDANNRTHSAWDDDTNTVETHTPTKTMNRSFKTFPNTNYAKHYDPDGVSQKDERPWSSTNPVATNNVFQTPLPQRDLTSPQSRTAIRPPQFRSSTNGDGGSLGVYSHANSPLRKSVSTNYPPMAAQLAMNGGAGGSSNIATSGAGSRSISMGVQADPARQRPRARSPIKREGSPLKQSSTLASGAGARASQFQRLPPAGRDSRRTESNYY